jgi:hypothetical protein
MIGYRMAGHALLPVHAALAARDAVGNLLKQTQTFILSNIHHRGRVDGKPLDGATLQTSIFHAVLGVPVSGLFSLNVLPGRAL